MDQDQTIPTSHQHFLILAVVLGDPSFPLTLASIESGLLEQRGAHPVKVVAMSKA